MWFHLTQASHRVLERASRLRLQRGIAAISSAKILWALFEEDECRAAQWLGEAGLTLEQFLTAFGIQTLRSPISAPAFPAGSYGISAGQYAPPSPPSDALEAASTGNNSRPVGNPNSDSPPDESEHEQPDEPTEPIQDDWQPSEPPKYSLYSKQQQGRKASGQSRLQFYLDDQHVNIGLLTPELEDTLEMVAHRFIRQDQRQAISVAGGVKQIALGTPTLTLLTEHLFLAVVLDPGDVGRWIQENGFEAAELYQRIDAGETGDGRQQMAADFISETQPLDCDPHADTGFVNQQTLENSAAVCRLPSAVSNIYRLLDAAANRGREAMRVLEDYVRFILGDTDLTQRLKTFRHQFQNVLQQFPMESRLEARNTESDVGTDISAEGEYERPTMDDLLSANFSRLQESLRSLEEFSKMLNPQTARQFEQLRYQGYMLHKDVALPQNGGNSSSDLAALETAESVSSSSCNRSQSTLES